MLNTMPAPCAQQIAFTVFPSLTNSTGNRCAGTWDDICNLVTTESPVENERERLPLIKLATFAGDRRSDETLETIYGIEGDYDAGEVRPDAAVALLQAAGVEAVIVTTGRHQPDRPRWRVLVPLAAPAAPADRHQLVARLNGVLGGILAPESFTAAQAFFYGSVRGGHPVQSWRTTGAAIDLVQGIVPVCPPLPLLQSERRSGGRLAPDYAVALRALQSRHPSGFDRNEWLALSGAFFTATGGTDQALVDWQAWNVAHGAANDPAANARTWSDYARNGTAGGAWTLAAFSHDVDAAARLYGFGVTVAPVATKRKGGLFVRVADMVARDPDYIVANLIEADALGMVFGVPKSGKSLVTLDLAACVATGSPFHGRETKQGTVFYLAGEGHGGLRRRFGAWEAVHGRTLADAPLFVSQSAVQMLDPTSLGEATEATAALAAQFGPPRLIVVDTVARCFGPGDENSTADMNRFVAALDTLRSSYPGATVLVVHHSGIADKDRGRGSSVLRAAIDVEFRVEGSDGAATLHNTLCKEASPQPSMRFELVEASGSVALRFSDEPSNRELSASVQRAFEAFRVVAVDGTATDGAWRTAFYERHPGSPDSKRKAYFRAKHDLTTRKIVVEDGSDGFKFSGEI